MPPRLSKRQQREQEEIAALSNNNITNETVSEKDDTEASINDASGEVKGPSKAGFSLLMGNVDDDAEDGDESDQVAETSKSSGKKKNKKKKKKPSATSTNAVATPSVVTSAVAGAVAVEVVTPSRKDKQSAKKGKKKANQGDDLDRALAELSLKYPDLASPNINFSEETTPATVSALQNLRSCLTIQSKHLDPDAEMKRFFGSKVINAAESSSSHGHGGPQPRVPLARSVLCRPQPTWPPAGFRDGLTMRPLIREEMETPYEPGMGMMGTSSWLLMPGDKWFTVEHSPGYRWDQAHFLQVVNMLDPNNLFALMRESYWHVDTLLQIGEVYRAQDDYSVSSDFTSRALFAYEKGFSGAFNMTNGSSRLDFRKVENRSLFLALHRTIIYLERRGTMRTAFEFAKVLWSLDPWTDPQGALLHLDFLAVKADQYQWFREVETAWDEICIEKRSLLPLHSIPGWQWSKALLLRGVSAKQGGGEKSATEVLKQAILSFPEVLASLAPLIGLTIPAGTSFPPLLSRWNPSNEADSSLWLLAQVYAHRSISLWKIPETLSWLNGTLREISQDISTSRADAFPHRRSLFSHLQGSLWKLTVIRHAIVADIKPLSPLLGSILAHFGPQDAYDPLPPQGYGVTHYDEKYLSSASADTAKKRREQPENRQRRGRNERVEVDPIEVLQMLEALLSFDVDVERRDQMLGALQDGHGAAIVRQLERWIRQHPEFGEQYPNARGYLLLPPDQRPRPGQPGPPQRNVGNAAPVAYLPIDDIDEVLPLHPRMPGALADTEMQEDEEYEEYEDHEGESDDDSEGGNQQGAAMLPIRIARGLVNMFWGGRPPSTSESDSEDDAEANYEAEDP